MQGDFFEEEISLGKEERREAKELLRNNLRE